MTNPTKIKTKPEPIKTMGDIWDAYDELFRLGMERLNLKNRGIHIQDFPGQRLEEKEDALARRINEIRDRPVNSC